MKAWQGIKWLLLAALLVGAAGGAGGPKTAEAAGVIRIFMDGEELVSDVAPYVVPKANVTMVPLAVISRGMGANVSWDGPSKTVTIIDGPSVITMASGAKSAFVNGAEVVLGASVQARGGRIMVPLRFVGEQLGLTVVWNAVDATIALQNGASGNPSGGGTGGTGSPPGTDSGQGGGPVTLPGTGAGNDTLNGLRGAWISTVYNLDWPTKASAGKAEQQKQEFLTLLGELQAMGMNAVFVQVRPAGDAFYPSTLAPWSEALSGKQGTAPNYDPLAFMIEETHKRGMEFHAWFNPFRASVNTKLDNLADNHVAKLHPEWIVNAGGILYVNPGIPEARQHIVDVIAEVANGYDVDGVHLDDYFYPSSGTFADDAAFAQYNPSGIKDKGDWRRENINAFVRQVDAAVHATKPDMRFGISPFGVWRNKAVDASGSDTKAGVTAYDSMNADVRTWIKQGWVDYVAPQLYWSFQTSAAPYGKLVDWWAQEVRGTGVDLYIGHAGHKVGGKEAGWQSAQEIIDQLRYSAQYAEVKGNLFFSAKDLRKNPLGLIEALRQYNGMAA
ncbi:family 10 glycosylhydrolase [Paenibacillus aurantiacus]|uniref:Family 10 glycosylhydrolase n=1 Tax=Paenibacillus aurantiacus TaxID=1936118 RepID=A0ABV5KM51_9BACL